MVDGYWTGMEEFGVLSWRCRVQHLSCMNLSTEWIWIEWMVQEASTWLKSLTSVTRCSRIWSLIIAIRWDS